MDELVSKLDPERNYGDRSYEQVVDAVHRGELRLVPGRSLPVIFDAHTNQTVKGTGQPPLPEGVDFHRWGRKRFNERAAHDFDEVYEAIIHSAKQGDVRAQKLFVETFLGRPQPDQRDDGAALARLMALLSAPRTYAIDEQGREIRD